MITDYSNRKSNNNNNISSLFRIFIEIAKYKDDNDKLEIQNFFRMFLNFNVYLYKFYDLTEYEIQRLNNLYQICPNMFWNDKNYYIINLDNYEIYSDFNTKRLDFGYLYSANLVNYDNKKFIDNLIKSCNCKYPDIYYDCLYVKVNNINPFYLFYTDIFHNKNLIKYFAKYSFLIDNNYLQEYNQIVDSFVDGNKKWISRYFIQLPRRIINSNLITNTLILRLSSCYNYTYRKFMLTIHIENFDNSDFEIIKNRIPAYSIQFNIANKTELYKIIETINNNLSNMSYSYEETSNNVFIIDYSIELKYTYKDVLNFLKQLMLASYMVYL